MDLICRLCLSASINVTSKLGEENKILDRLSSLNIQIVMNKSLPTAVCHECCKTVEHFLKFKETIVLNQNKLLELLNHGKDLEDYLISLKSKVIKAELEYEEDIISNEALYYEAFTNKTKQDVKELDIKSEINEIVENDSVVHEKVNKKCLRKLSSRFKRYKKFKSEDFDSVTHVDAEINDSKFTENINEDDINSIDTKINETELVDIENSRSKLNKIDRIENQVNKCLTCLTKLPSRKELIKHYKIVHSLTKRCEKTDCQQNDSENKCTTNVSPKTSIEKELYNCKICGRTFTSVYAIVRHSQAHSDSLLYCSQGCGYNTVYRGALRDHEKRHSNNYKYKCATCGIGFQVKTWHDQHQNIHNNVKPFICQICGMAFHMDRYLTSHRSSVHSDVIKGTKQFVCPHCNINFDNIRNYKTHLQEHEGKKRYLCDVCGKECSSKDQLKQHTNSHLGLKPHTCRSAEGIHYIELAVVSSKAQSPLEIICNKSFSKKFNLSVHSRAHAGEKCVCTVCGNHFAQRSTLRRHIRKCHPEIKKQEE